MPWRDLLSSAQRAQVMALPVSLREYEELTRLLPPIWNLWRRIALVRTGWVLPCNSASCDIRAGHGPRRKLCQRRCFGSPLPLPEF